MKRVSLLSVMLLAALTAGYGQGSLGVEMILTVADTATTTWDSVWIGPSTREKILTVTNDGAVNLYVALEDDTAAGEYAILKQNEVFTIERLQSTHFIRLKSASSTALYRVRSLR